MTRGLFSQTIAWTASIFLFLLAGGLIFRSWRYWPLACFIFFWAGMIAIAVNAAFRVRRGFKPVEELAGDLGKKTGNGSLFSSALEFSEEGKRLEQYSGFLMKETVKRASRKIAKISPSDTFEAEGKTGWMILASVLSMILLLITFSSSRQAAGLLRSLGDPGVSFSFRPGNNLLLTVRDTTVVAGEDITVKAVRMGSLRGKVEIRFSSLPGVWKREAVKQGEDLPEGERERNFRHTFRNAEEDIEYYFTSGGERTRSGRISVIQKPIINCIGAILDYPAYTGKAPDTLSALAGKTAVLFGTRVVLSGEVNKPAVSARADFSSGLKVDLNTEGKRFSGEFMAEKSDTIRFSVTDSAGLVSDSPVRYPLVCRSDRAPSIEILSPEDHAVLPRSLRTTLLFRATDDYGVSEIHLRYMKEGRDISFSTEVIEKKDENISKEIERPYEWSLEEERVFPGDRIDYYMEAWDNNDLNGPGYARTKVFRITMPSLSDLYELARKKDQLREKDFEDILEESNEIRQRLKKFSDEFKAAGQMDWESREEGKEILGIQEKIREKIREAAGSIEKSLGELEENRMTSMEIGRKMEEIQELLERIESEDLAKSIEKLQELMRDMPESEVSSALDDIDLQAEDLSESLDRTIELLNRIIREEKMEELLRRMEDIIERQISLRDSTENGDLDRIAEKEKELKSDYSSLENDMRDFAESTGEKETGSETEELVKKIDEAKAAPHMQEAVSRMESGERSEARKAESDAVNEMFSLYTSLGRFQMSMNMVAEIEAARIVESSLWKLIEISRLSESFAGQAALRSAPSRLDSLLEEQAVIRDAIRKVLGDLLEAARMRLGISRSVFSHLSAALVTIEDVIASMENRRFSQAADRSNQIMTELNLTIIELLKTSSASGGSGGNSGQSMQSMLNGQTSIDRQLKEMMGGGDSGNSLEARAKMARLAAEQRKMEELLQRIKEESLGTGEIIGKLDDMGSEMKEIAGQLDEGRLDKELIKREERILSRMLESQRSLNRRDYKRERVSRTAGNMGAKDAVEKSGKKDELEFILEKIRRGMQEKGPAEYEELIRAYFRALSRRAREGATR
ncbi:MAG: hypothetical protein JW746_05530 [Candidatus Krumholzibacteriota bacterium]|nr:hypothetical protein [Candidatus Krumholzibacteriota bacterium]